MEKRLESLQQRLQTSLNDQSCRTLSNEIDRLSSALSNFVPIYRTNITREQLLLSIKNIQDLIFDHENNDLYRRALVNYLLLVSIHTHKHVCGLILDHMFVLKQHLNYWKANQQLSLNFIEQIKTTYWFDQARDEIRIDQKIKYLTQQDELLANTLGRLAYTVTNLEQQEHMNLDFIMNSTNKIYEVLFDASRVNYNSQSDLVDVIELYSQMLNSLDEFRLQLNAKIDLYHRPTHLKRYFPYYVCFAVLGSYAIYKIYRNKDNIENYVYTSYDSLKFFINEHLIIPLKTIYSSTFQSRSSQIEFENSQINYLNSKKILEEMIEEYGRKHANALAKIDNSSVNEFLFKLNERAKNEDMNIVMKYYQQELNSPIRSAIIGDLIKGILIQVQKVKVDGEGLVIQIDQLMKQNQINFSLLATIPALLVLTFVGIATKNIIANRLIRQRKYDLSTLRQKIIRKLREIEHVLIFNRSQPSLTYSSHNLLVNERNTNEHGTIENKIMTDVTLGHFLLLIYELKHFTRQLQSKRMFSDEFNNDINLLTYTQLSVQQKLLVIQQIFHSYSYLVHS